MAFEDAFLDMMIHTVTWKTPVGKNGYGEIDYSPGTDIRCRVVAKEQIIRRPGDRELRSNVTVYVAGSPGVQEDDLIEFQDGETLPVLVVRRYPDEDGDHHEVLVLGWHGLQSA